MRQGQLSNDLFRMGRVERVEGDKKIRGVAGKLLQPEEDWGDK